MNSRQAEVDEMSTREVIADLFNHPPVNEAELKQRLQSVEVHVARRLIVDKLDSRSLPDRAGPLFLALMGEIGIARQKDRLTDIALDLSRCSRERLWAAMALASEDPKAMDMLADRLGPEGMSLLAELSLFELLTMQNPTDIGGSIATALTTLMDERPADELLARIETCRKGIGVSCSRAYGESLHKAELAPIRLKILDQFIHEASEEGIEFLSRMRDDALNPEERRNYQTALLKLRSRQIDINRDEEEIPGYALVSNCDGQGDYIVLGVVENGDNTFTVADLCLRADGDVRDGAIYPRRNEREVEEIASDVQHSLGCYFVEVTLPEAATLVDRSVTLTRDMSQQIPEEARPGVALLERCQHGYRWGEGSCCPPQAVEPTTDAIRALLERPEYEDTWFFDAGDLGGSNIEPPPSNNNIDAWINGIVDKLDHNVKSRLIAMAEHMAKWHYWNQEPAVSSLCRAIAARVRQGIENNPIVYVMLERSVETLQYSTTELVCQFGDPSVRQHFKSLFFHDIKVPTGRDLAYLDLTEATASALDAAFELLPGQDRPRDEERDLAAFAVGKVFGERVIRNGLPSPDQVIPDMAEALENTCRLSKSEQHEVLMTVVPSLYAFVEEICSICPVDCLNNPDRDYSHVFFRPEHPISPPHGK